METRRGVGRPRKSCDLCHELKVRCSGDRSGCNRCLRIGRKCRWTGKASRPSIPPAQSRTTFTVDLQPPSTQTVDTRSQQRLSPESTPEAGIAGIPTSLVIPLKDIYFYTAYNADLLLHKRHFEDALSAGTVPEHIVLSMCAWAAIFYRDANDRATLKEDGFMMDWATRAGKLALANAEDLEEDSVVTYTILSLFWASQGQWRRSVLHKLAAFQVINVLGLRASPRPGEAAWQAELRRRRFWACYTMDCHSAAELHLTRSLADPSTVPLPWSESNFDSEIPPEWNAMLHPDPSQPCGVYASALQGFSLWTAAISELKPSPHQDRKSLASLYELDEEITSWWSSNPYKLTKANFTTWSKHELPRVIMVNVVYHQAVCAIHAAFVPLFRGVGLANGEKISSHARPVSAQVALEHAQAISELASLILSAEKDLIGALPSFTAYALYCACAIQLPFLRCLDSRLQSEAQANISVTLTLLEECSAFWKSARIMSKYISVLQHIHAQHGRIMDAEPRHLRDDSQLQAITNPTGSQSSVLEFIAWSRQGGDDGYVASGAERDLQFEPVKTSPNSLQIPSEAAQPVTDPTLPPFDSGSLDLLFPFADPDMIGWFFNEGTPDWVRELEQANLFSTEQL